MTWIMTYERDFMHRLCMIFLLHFLHKLLFEVYNYLDRGSIYLLVLFCTKAEYDIVRNSLSLVLMIIVVCNKRVKALTLWSFEFFGPC